MHGSPELCAALAQSLQEATRAQAKTQSNLQGLRTERSNKGFAPKFVGALTVCDGGKMAYQLDLPKRMTGGYEENRRGSHRRLRKVKIPSRVGTLWPFHDQRT